MQAMRASDVARRPQPERDGGGQWIEHLLTNDWSRH